MSTVTRCARCGRENDPRLAYCLDCGQPLRASTPRETAALCAACGAPLQPGFRFCGACGKPAGSGLSPAAAPPPLPAARAAPALHIRLTLVRNDGQPGAVFDVPRQEALCGRTDGEIRLPDDPTVSPRHARFTIANGVLRVEDLGSVNGTFVRLREPRRLSTGDELRAGRQLLRLEPLPRPAPGEHGVRPWGTRDAGCRLRLSQLLEGGGLGEIFPLREGENVLGREGGEITFPADRYVSGRHAVLKVAGAEVTLSDAGSSNGTYVKLGGAAELAPGDQLLVGGQLLRVD